MCQPSLPSPLSSACVLLLTTPPPPHTPTHTPTHIHTHPPTHTLSHSLGARLGKSASDRRVGTGAGNNNNNGNGKQPGQSLRPKGMVYSESTPALGNTGGGGSPGGLPKPGANAARSGIASQRPTATAGSAAAIFGSNSRFMSRFVFLTARHYPSCDTKHQCSTARLHFCSTNATSTSTISHHITLSIALGW